MSGTILSTILKHDSKVTSYKIALLRAINDVVLSFPTMRGQDGAHERDHKRAQESAHECAVAVPLRFLAQCWVAYYWPFANQDKPLLQGPVSKRAGGISNDMAFRPHLTRLRAAWEDLSGGVSRASDGFFLANELRLPRKRELYPQEFLMAYQEAIRAVSSTLQMPIRYAGPGEWTVFEKPQPYRQLAEQRGNAIAPLPGTREAEVCLVVEASLWQTFCDLSLWIEALCIHEWCLFTERVEQPAGLKVERGVVYQLLTDRPDNRRPLTWERNHVDILLLEGKEFLCPWTERPVRLGAYAIDHLLPVSLYPINELWNLVPADAAFNSHVKRDRLPSSARLAAATPFLELAYANYQASKPLFIAMREDVAVRFSGLRPSEADFTHQLAKAVGHFMESVAASRNLSRF